MLIHPRRALVILVFMAYISLGLPDAVNGLAWPSVRHAFGVPISSLGWLLVTGMVGYLVASSTSVRVVARVGVGWVLVGSGTLIVVGLTGFALAPTWWVMVACGAFAGLGAGAIDAGLNAWAADHFQPRLMTWMHACWGIGATVGPLLMTAAIAGGWGWRWGYGVLAALIAVMSVGFFWKRKYWDDGPAGQASESTGPLPASAAIGQWRVWLNVALFFVYTGLETAIGAWTPSLLTESRGVPNGAAGTAVATYWASMTVGRLVIGSFANKVAVDTILRAATVLAPVSILLVCWTSNYALNVTGMVLLGVALAPIYPLLMSQTPKRFGRGVAVHAIAFQVSAGCLGMALVPAILGYIARWTNLESVGTGFLVLALAMLAANEVARGKGEAEQPESDPTPATSGQRLEEPELGRNAPV